MGPALTVPCAPEAWVPKSVPLVVGVARTFRLAVVWTRLPITNLVEGGGGGGGVGVGLGGGGDGGGGEGGGGGDDGPLITV